MSSQYGTLLGVALGALIVGTTLTVYDALSDPVVRDEVGNRVRRTYASAKEKVGKTCEVARKKADEARQAVRGAVEDGYAAVATRAGEAGATIRQAIENMPAVRRIREKVDATRSGRADKAEEAGTEEEETHPVAFDLPEEETHDSMAEGDEHPPFSAT